MEAVLNIPGTQASFHIGESSSIAAARRAGNELARRVGFDEVRTGQLAIVITEAATNLIKHAGHGEILLRSLADGARKGIEVLAIDRGPGMANVTLRMEDGHSTVGSYGVGMGAIRRLTQEFDIYSVEGQGTVLLMVLWDSAATEPIGPWQVGAVCLPLAGEDMCGDAWGSGTGALAAARPELSPRALVSLAHDALRGTRGAALAALVIDLTRQELVFAGVGNIAGCVFENGTRRHLMSHNGIVGSNLRKVQEFVLSWNPGAMVLLHSDGIATRWDLDAYAGLEFRHPSLIAAVLYRDFARQRDDVLVLVVRQRSSLT
jgi:anti-sigma regulatory factor (Ser/Thr protein kinase)